MNDGLCSLCTFWTVYIPYYLLPLPYKILKRDFSFANVQTSLAILPFAVFWSFAAFLSFDGTEHAWLIWVFFFSLMLSVLLAPILFILIRLKGIQRWGKPIASRPRFSKLYRPKKDELEPVTFTIDSAPEDKRYARTIVRRLEKYGHKYTASKKVADIGIVLLSAFKTDSCLNPEKQVVYPVILQKTNVTDPRLKRIQWIDFRQGTRNIKSFCLLLSQPEKMVKALGIVPPGKQTVLPKIIQITSYYLLVMCLFQLGSILTLLPQNLVVSVPQLHTLIILAACFMIISAAAYQSLVTRKGLLNSVPRLWVSLLVLGGLLIAQTLITSDEYNKNSDQIAASMADVLASFSSNMTFVIYSGIVIIYLLGLPLIFFGTIFSWRDLRRWLYR